MVDEQQAGARLDRFCVDNFPAHSRERIKAMITDGSITISGITKPKPSMKVEAGQVITCAAQEALDADPEPENIPLDILYEDDDVIVLNKPAGLVVHPAAGNWTGTLVNALLYHCADSLSGVGGVKRPGIVHRLDKDTSGVMLVAKNDQAHAHLSAQLADRSLSRVYVALVWDIPMPPIGTIDIPMGRDHKNRLKQAIKRGEGAGRDAITHYRTLQTFGNAMALVECRLETGRTHQIRVHMQAKGHPLVGDPLYGAQKTLQISRLGYFDDLENKETFLNFPRQALHAREIKFIHPKTEEEMHFVAEISDDFQSLINLLK